MAPSSCQPVQSPGSCYELAPRRWARIPTELRRWTQGRSTILQPLTSGHWVSCSSSWSVIGYGCVLKLRIPSFAY